MTTPIILLPNSGHSEELRPQEKPKTNRFAEIYRNHSDLISSISNDILNTIILVSRVVKQIPNFVNRSAYFAYNITGMFWMNMQVRDLRKNITDFCINFAASDIEGIVASAARVTVVALNIILSASLFTAALISLAGMPQIALAMYSVMRPFSLFSFFTHIGWELYNFVKNDLLASKLSCLSSARFHSEITGDLKNVETAEKVAKFFIYYLYNEQPKGCGDLEKKFARHTFKQLSYFQTDAMLQKFHKEYQAYSARALIAVFKQDPSKIDKLLSDLNKGMRDKNTYTKNNLGLVLLGYVCMGICKAYPDTLVQSSVTWGISLLYTLKKIYEKTVNKQWTNSLI